jgi:hypothetical protein
MERLVGMGPQSLLLIKATARLPLQVEVVLPQKIPEQVQRPAESPAVAIPLFFLAETTMRIRKCWICLCGRMGYSLLEKLENIITKGFQ